MTFETCSVEMELYASTKRFDPDQPAHSAQADLNRNVFLSITFPHDKGLVLPGVFTHNIDFMELLFCDDLLLSYTTEWH